MRHCLEKGLKAIVAMLVQLLNTLTVYAETKLIYPSIGKRF
jgi:hypothetical protein